MTRKYEYLEIEDGKSIHPGIAISQAAQLLDLAASMATDTKDIDRMIKVSTKWLTMGERLAEIMEVVDSDEDEEENPEEKITLGFGFGTGLEIQDPKKEGEEIDGTDEDKC